MLQEVVEKPLVINVGDKARRGYVTFVGGQ